MCVNIQQRDNVYCSLSEKKGNWGILRLYTIEELKEYLEGHEGQVSMVGGVDGQDAKITLIKTRAVCGGGPIRQDRLFQPENFTPYDPVKFAYFQKMSEFCEDCNV